MICEGDSDCRFYASVMSAIVDATPDARVPDVMFVHCGGKQRIPSVARALRQLDVPVSVVVDFDILREEEPLRSIFTELGGDWSKLNPLWHRVSAAITSKRGALDVDDVRSRVVKILDRVSGKTLQDRDIEEIREILKKASAWSDAKEMGAKFVPPGDATVALEQMLALTSNVGLHIVHVGEVESFDRACAGESTAWVNRVLQKDLLRDPGLQAAREFVKQVLAL